MGAKFRQRLATAIWISVSFASGGPQALAGSMIYPDTGSLSFFPVVSGGFECSSGRCIRITPSCFGTNLRTSDNSISPFADITMEFTWKTGAPNVVPPFKLTFSAALAKPAQGEQVECSVYDEHGSGPVYLLSGWQLGSFGPGAKGIFMFCWDFHDPGSLETKHLCKVDHSTSDLVCKGWVNDLPHYSVRHTCTVTETFSSGTEKDDPKTARCNHTYKTGDEAIRLSLVNIDGTPFSSEDAIVSKEGNSALIRFPKSTSYSFNSVTPDWNIKYTEVSSPDGYFKETSYTEPGHFWIGMDVVDGSLPVGTSWIADQRRMRVNDKITFKDKTGTVTTRNVNRICGDKPIIELDQPVTVDPDTPVFKQRVFPAPYPWETPADISYRGSVDTNTDKKALLINPDFPGQEGYCGSFQSPLMLFFDNKRPHFSGASSFPLDPAGRDIYWVEQGAPGYFLAVDDGTGKITRANQLFGNSEGDRNGFEALKRYDQNQDLKIDKDDPIFSRLLLWNDRNGDGISQPSELRLPADLGLVTISLFMTA